MSFTFDTLAYVRRLREAHVADDQAEGMADALKGALSGPQALATRRDLDDLENRLTIKLGGIIVLAVGLATAVLGFLIAIK